MALQPHHIFKLVIAGPTDVGKTTFILRYTDKIFFAESKKTVGVDFALKKVAVNLPGNGAHIHQIAFQLWDFAGQDHFRFMLEGYAMGASAALILIDLTRFNTTENLEEWINICRSDVKDIPILLIGSKSDLLNDIVINDTDAKIIKEKYNFLDYVKVSSKTGENVEEAFKLLINNLLEKHGILS